MTEETSLGSSETSSGREATEVESDPVYQQFVEIVGGEDVEIPFVRRRGLKFQLVALELAQALEIPDLLKSKKMQRWLKQVERRAGEWFTAERLSNDPKYQETLSPQEFYERHRSDQKNMDATRELVLDMARGLQELNPHLSDQEARNKAVEPFIVLWRDIWK